MPRKAIKDKTMTHGIVRHVFPTAGRDVCEWGLYMLRVVGSDGWNYSWRLKDNVFELIAEKKV